MARTPREFVEITRKDDAGNFLPCGTPRGFPEYPAYISEYPRCVNRNWLEQIEKLPPEERELRLQYSILAKRVAMMEACYVPGQEQVAVRNDPPPGSNLVELVEELKQRYDELRSMIQEERHCAEVEWTRGKPHRAEVAGPQLDLHREVVRSHGLRFDPVVEQEAAQAEREGAVVWYVIRDLRSAAHPSTHKRLERISRAGVPLMIFVLDPPKKHLRLAARLEEDSLEVQARDKAGTLRSSRGIVDVTNRERLLDDIDKIYRRL